MTRVTLWKSKQLKENLGNRSAVGGRTIKQDCVKEHFMNHQVHTDFGESVPTPCPAPNHFSPEQLSHNSNLFESGT